METTEKLRKRDNSYLILPKDIIERENTRKEIAVGIRKKHSSEDIKRIKRAAVPILKKNGVVKAGIFGSYATGKAKKESDIDMLIKFKGRKSLLDLAGLKLELENRLGKKVDVLTYKSVHPLLKERIMRDEERIL